MSGWSKFSLDELERRRTSSIAALRVLYDKAWAREYQEICDTEYWTNGQCCAGCDHWDSGAGRTGQCTASPIVSGADVMRSLNIEWSSYIYKPSHPYTKSDYVCGVFKDDFDWSTLDEIYLRRIGAVFNGKLQKKPEMKRVQK